MFEDSIYNFVYFNEQDERIATRTVNVRVNKYEQEVFQPEIFYKAVKENLHKPWRKCEVYNEYGNKVNTYWYNG